MTSSSSSLNIAHVFPGFLGQYGHQGNALVLAQRCRFRGIACEVIEVPIGHPIPRLADCYLLAGGDCQGVPTMASALQQDRGLQQAAERGAVVIGLGSGYQLLGHHIRPLRGQACTGVGLLDVQAAPAPQRRFGAVVAEPCLPIVSPVLGFEDHQMTIRLGPDAQPLATLRQGWGNGLGQGSEGAWQGHVVGSSLRGPLLALNPSLADWILERLLGSLQPLSLDAVERLRQRFLSGLRSGS